MPPLQSSQQDSIIQLLTMICALEILISQIIHLRITNNGVAKAMIVVIMSGVLHNVIFYVCLTLDRFVFPAITPLFGSYTIWSVVRTFHLFFVMAIVEYMRLRIAYDVWKLKHPEGVRLYLLKNRGVHD